MSAETITIDSETAYRRSYEEVLEERLQDEGLQTKTSIEQNRTETDVLRIYESSLGLVEPRLRRKEHTAFLKKSLRHLSTAHESMDSSRPWLCYWSLHTLELLGERLEDEEYRNIVKFLAKCQAPVGGFGGGPGQYPHLAPTYAAVNALCIIGTKEAYEVIDRPGLRRFIMSLHLEDGGFSMQVDGEVDLRGVYCALTVAKLTNIYSPEMFNESVKWISKCQNWEGGFGACPGAEAHGGYTFCALGALVLFGEPNLCPTKPLLRWIVNRQMRLEGGFQGRPNKLVDACYSFWQGSSLTIIHTILWMKERNKINYWLFNQEALQEYILTCCQHPYGGFLDKPEKWYDVYHTCYAVSGLSVAQHSSKPVAIGPPNINLVKLIHPVYNLTHECVVNAQKYFGALPIPS